MKEQDTKFPRASLKTERGWVEDQPQHGENIPKRRNCGTGCGWSRTTQPRLYVGIVTGKR